MVRCAVGCDTLSAFGEHPAQAANMAATAAATIYRLATGHLHPGSHFVVSAFYQPGRHLRGETSRYASYLHAGPHAAPYSDSSCSQSRCRPLQFSSRSGMVSMVGSDKVDGRRTGLQRKDWTDIEKPIPRH